MAKFFAWARNSFAKVRDSVAQHLTRLWSFLARWKWGAAGAALLACAGVVLWNYDHFAAKFGYDAVTTVTIQQDGKPTEVRETSVSSPGGRFLRDALIAIAALFALFVAAVRSYAFFRQTKTAADQFKQTESRHLSEWFANAAELMGRESTDGKPVISARISGIYIMESLAIKAAADFAEQVVKNLIAYIKDHIQLTARARPNAENSVYKCRVLGEDVKVAFAVLHSILSDKKLNAIIDGAILDFSQQNFSRLYLASPEVQLIHYKEWAGTNFEGSLLIGVDFSAALLSLANFSDAYLSGVSFKNATMAAAKFNKANIDHALMTEAYLGDAEMQKTQLLSADLRGADLTRANLSGSCLREARAQGAILERAKLNCAELTYAHLDGANLEAAELCGVEMQDSYLRGASLSNADLRGADLSRVVFGETEMYDVEIENGSLSEDTRKAMDKQIWHSGDSWAEDIEECRGDDWRLDEYTDGYAIAGVLQNFAENDDPMPPGDRARCLRAQAVELLHALPENTPRYWRDWLADIDPVSDMSEEEREYAEEYPD